MKIESINTTISDSLGSVENQISPGVFDTVNVAGSQLSHMLMTVLTAIADNPLIALVIVLLTGAHHCLRRKARLAGIDSGEADRAFIEQTLISGLGVMAIEVKGFAGSGSASSNPLVGSIFELYGLMAIFYIAVASIYYARYFRAALNIISHLESEPRSKFSWKIPAYAASLLLIFGCLYLFFGSDGKHPTVKDEIPPKEETAATQPALPENNHTLEIFETIAVSDERSQVLPEDSKLPEGLRFVWDQRNIGWEPAFIFTSDGESYSLSGNKIDKTQAGRAYAVDGPHVQPDRGSGYLQFHRDVLIHLSKLYGDSNNHLGNKIFVSSNHKGVVLRITGSGGPSRTIQVALTS